MEGWLQKKPETSIIYFQFGEILSWKTRYFVHDGFYLKYFKSETKQELLGQIDLQTVSDLRESKAFCGNGGYYGFELVTPKRVYCLVGTEEQVIIKWLNSLRLSIQTPITKEFQLAEAWIKDLSEACRSAIITIKNDTNLPLKREEADVIGPGQMFRIFPPEIILPHTERKFATQSHFGFCTGTHGKATYSLPDLGKIFFNWSNPFTMVLYRRYASCETTSAGIEVTWHGEDRATLRFSKFSYLTNCWDLVFEVKYENPNSEFCFDDFKIENETVQEEPHIDFQYNFASYYLTRSLIVKLHNHTKQTLTRSSYFLKHGVWISSILPPEKIPPNSTITWGCRNSVFMRGTEGHLHYQLVSNNAFKFSWNNPYIHGVYAFNHCEPKNYGINIISHKPGNMAELELELISLNSTESIAPTSTPIPAVTSPTPIMLFERQTIGKMIDKTELFRAVRQEIMIQKSHQFEKLKNRIALVSFNLKQNKDNPIFSKIFKPSGPRLPTCIEYVEIDTVQMCPVDQRRFTKKSEKNFCGLCGGIFCKTCIKTYSLPQSGDVIPVCIHCFSTINQQQKLQDFQTKIEKSANHPLFLTFIRLRDLSEEIQEILQTLSEDDQSSKKQLHKLAERLENLKSELNDLSKLEKEAPNNLNNINDNAIRVHVLPGNTVTISFALDSKTLALTDYHGTKVSVPGDYSIIFTNIS